MDALTPDLELRLRTELAERRVAELTAALDNMKVEMDRWRTIAECRLLPGAGMVVAADRVETSLRDQGSGTNSTHLR